jgi:hypothetical protein
MSDEWPVGVSAVAHSQRPLARLCASFSNPAAAPRLLPLWPLAAPDLRAAQAGHTPNACPAGHHAPS